ncbi:Uncharacterised protein [Neisseria meningitidis]|nr:Uncharacterised protein [Neisseria meningitidis]
MRRRRFRIGTGGKIIGIQFPQRLYCRIERAVRQRVNIAAQAQQFQKIRRRRSQITVPVQAADQAVFTVKAEHFFQTRHFRQNLVDQIRRLSVIHAEQAQLRAGTQRDTFPEKHIFIAFFIPVAFFAAGGKRIRQKRNRRARRRNGGSRQKTPAPEMPAHTAS